MKNTILLLNSLWLFGLVACQPKPVASLSECPVVNIRLCFARRGSDLHEGRCGEYRIRSFGND